MLDKIKQGYRDLTAKIADYVQRAETELSGASGEQKKKWVKDQIDLAITLPPIWDSIVNVDGLIVGILIDKICDTWNTVASGDLTIGKPEDIAKMIDLPVHTLNNPAREMPMATVDERIKAMLKEYGIEMTAPKPVNHIATTVGLTVDPAVEVKQDKEKNWKKCLSLVFGHEGGLSNNANDRGGLTNLGVTAGTLATANALGIAKETDVTKLTRDEAARIYHEMYWKKCGADNMHWFACYLAFDVCVNSGIGGFARVFQEALNAVYSSNLKVDGKYGPATEKACLKAFNVNLPVESTAKMNQFGTAYLAARKGYFDRIIERNASQEVFRKGWYNRLRGIAKNCNIQLPAGL
jgi:lysozyme family protein